MNYRSERFEQQENEKLLSTKEVAKLLGITPNALRIHVHRGNIPAKKLGYRLRFSLSEVLNALKTREA